jgi:DNA-binding GntR family transcriptional regulator
MRARTSAPLSKRQILEACPGVSAITVERALKSLLATGYIRKLGAGPATSYAKN